jgi:hypothetical protein
VLVGVFAGRSRTVRPEDPNVEPAEAKLLPRAGENDPNTSAPRRFAGRLLVGAAGGDPRVEQEADGKLVDDVCRAAHVIALRVREHSRGQPVSS